MARRVFVLGAGASHFAGYPLAADLWPFIRDNSGHHAMGTDRKREVVEYIENILTKLPPDQYDQPNLESLCTLLDLADQEIGPLALKKPWKGVRPKFVGMITEAFLHYQYSLDSRNETQINHVLDCWVRYLEPGDIVLTFNWDILHEAALWKAGKWNPYDGYGFVGSSESRASSPITILKLHGSTNWKQRHEYDQIPTVDHKAVFFPGTRKDDDIGGSIDAGWHEGRYLIVPTYLKDISTNAALLSLWNRAADALANAAQVIVIGYRLDTSDALARQLIALALLRNSKLKEIVVISPPDGPNHWDAFALTVGKQRKLVRLKFEEWILGPTILTT